MIIYNIQYIRVLYRNHIMKTIQYQNSNIYIIIIPIRNYTYIIQKCIIISLRLSTHICRGINNKYQL